MKAPQFQWNMRAFFLLFFCLRGGIVATAQLTSNTNAAVRGPGCSSCATSTVAGLDAKFRLSHPYTVSLRRRSDLGYFCAGVLISRKHVLTAAHCVDSSRTSADSWPEVVVNSPSSSKTSGFNVQVISAENVYIHPDFQSQRAPDLALIQLASAAKQAPIQLPTQFLPREGNALQAIGWGRKSPNSGNSKLVQIASMNFIQRGRCAGKINGAVHNHQICMGAAGVSSCEGDNGGPIIFPGRSREEDVLYGIVGSSHVCGESSRPDIHTSIWPYISWIKSTAGIP